MHNIFGRRFNSNTSFRKTMIYEFFAKNSRIKSFLLVVFILIILSSCKSTTDSEIMQPYSGKAQNQNAGDTTALSNVRISDAELRAIGYRIYTNECSGEIKNLTYWSPREPFPSMGIAHFIWYSTNYGSPLGDSFSKMLMFYEQNGINLPGWVKKTNYKCPWTTRTAFYRDFNSPQMKYLRDLLKSTMYLQTKFIIVRFQEKTNRIFQASKTPQMRQHVQYQFYRVASSPMGVYALIDYVNFKGAGTMNSGGWGLLQVLENMKGQGTGKKAVIEFANSAKTVLKNRVSQSKNKSTESKNLRGWYRRIDTYCQ